MPTRIVKNGKEFWRAVWTENRKRMTRRFTNMEEAARFEADMRGIIPSALLQPTGRMEATLLSLFAGYVNAMQNKGLGSQSITEKRTVYESFTECFGPYTLATSVGYAECEAFLGRVADKRSRARANRYRCHLLAAWRWGVRALRLPADCPWAVDKFRADKKQRYVPSEADFWRVYGAADEWDKRLLLTYLHTAARKSELLALTWDNVDLVEGTLRLSTRKRSGGLESDIIPMTGDVRTALEAQKRAIDSGKVVSINRDRRVFVSLEHGKPVGYFKELMADLCAGAGVRPFGFHAIRHLSASILAKSGMPAWQVQKILRHRSITTTQIYVHSLTGVRADMDGAFGVTGGKDGGLRNAHFGSPPGGGRA